ncbi:hypothetical protein G6F31_018146 [Rhizopus arrhizus]|nr:hypothetical protein G6F31_018146 [Rhizopus arrhizus]
MAPEQPAAGRRQAEDSTRPQRHRPGIAIAAREGAGAARHVQEHRVDQKHAERQRRQRGQPRQPGRGHDPLECGQRHERHGQAEVIVEVGVQRMAVGHGRHA